MAGLMGVAEPRLCTEPLRPLNSETSRGYSVAAFADQVLGQPLLPWQRELAIRALELNPDGTYRFRTVVCLVARQNGKTHLLKTLALWRIYVDRARLVVGAAQSLAIAKEAWRGAAMLAESTPALRPEFVRWYRDNNDPHVLFANDARYKIVAANRGAGRGLSVDMLIMDELREQRDWDAWGALSGTTTARPNGQVWCISNAGDTESVVLNQLRETGLSGRDPSLGLFEWSAPDGCELDDPVAWAQANPALGITVSEAALRAAYGTDPPAVFRTERLCQRVEALDSAVDLGAWRASLDHASTLASVRDRLVGCVDVGLDGGHVTFAVAGLGADGRVRGEIHSAWRSVEEAARELRAAVEQVGPVSLRWFPSGPAAALGPLMRSLGAEGITGTEVTEACMSFAALVASRGFVHSGQALLDAHVGGAHKYRQGDGWRFSRYGQQHCDAAYAMAGAVQGARTLPAAPRRWEGMHVV